jgi:DNA-binding beta-propeller fold protein YncE
MRAFYVALALSLAACGDTKIVFNGDSQWNESRELISAGARLAFTNSGDDTISWLDAQTFEPLANIPVGFLPVEPEGPHHLQATGDGAALFVGISNYVERGASGNGPHGSHGTGTSDGYLLKLSGTNGAELGRTRVKRSPGDLRINFKRNLVFQSHFDLASVIEAVNEMKPPPELDSFLIGTDVATMERKMDIRVCSAGHGIGFSPDENTAYVVCYMSDQLAVVDLETQVVQRLILGQDAGAPPAPRYQPYALAVAPDGRVFISTGGPGKKGVMVYEPGQAEIDSSSLMPTEGAALFGDFNNDGSRFYVVTQSPDRLAIIDTAAMTVLEEKDLAAHNCRNAHLARVSPDESQLWIVCEGARTKTPGNFLVLDRNSLEEIHQAPLGIYPDDLAYLPPVAFN